MESAVSPRRLLFVDDEFNNNRYYTAFAESHSYEAKCVEDSSVALAAALEMLPDLIILDVDMPGVDGFDVLQQLRAEPRTAAIPVLFLTATVVDFESRVRGLNMGACDYVINPIPPDELKERIDRCFVKY